jgi:hypothetical protein
MNPKEKLVADKLRAHIPQSLQLLK